MILTHLLARLNRNRNKVNVPEIETENGVRDPGRAPVVDEEIEAANVVEVDLPGFPLAGVIELGAVVAVAQVVDGDDVPVDIRIRGARDVGLPVFVVRRTSVNHQRVTMSGQARQPAMRLQKVLKKASAITRASR